MSIARSSADSADSASASTGAPSPLAELRVGGDRAGGDAAEVERRAGEVEQRAGVGRAGAAGRDLPDDAAADRLVHQLAERRAGDVEELERLVDVVGQEEAADRVDHPRRLDLVDVGLGGVVAARRRVDEAEHQARRQGQARRQPERVAGGRRGVDRRRCAVDRRGRGGAVRRRRHHQPLRRAQALDRQRERAPERIDQARALQPRRAAAQPERRVAADVGIGERVVGLPLAHQAAVVREAEQLLANAVEAGADDVELVDRGGDARQRRLGRFARLAGAVVVALLLAFEPGAHGAAQRRRRAGRQHAAAAQGARRRRRRRAVGAGRGGGLHVDAAERPALEAIAEVERDLPLEPERDPRLRPRGHADRIGVDALVEREAAQLVGDALVGELAGRAAGHLHLARERAAGAVVDRVGAAEAERRLGDHAAARRLAVEAVLGGGDAGDPGRPVRVVQHQLAREQRHFVGDRGGAERRQDVGAVDHLVDGADHLRRIAAVQLAVARGAAVAAVAQAPLRAAHRDQRLERRVEARRRLAHFARARRGAAGGLGRHALGLALALGLAPRHHLGALRVLRDDVQVLLLLGEGDLRSRARLALDRRGRRARDRAARMAADRERAAVGAFEQSIGAGVAARPARVAGGVLPFLDVDEAVGAVDAVDEVAGEGGEQALVRAPRRRVGGRERDRRERRGDVVAVLAPDELDVVGARPVLGAGGADRHAVQAAVQQAAARPVRLGLDDRARACRRTPRSRTAGRAWRSATSRSSPAAPSRCRSTWAHSASPRRGRSTPACPARRGARAAASRRPRGPRRAPSRARAAARAGCSRSARRRADRVPGRSTSRRRGRRAGRLRCRSARPGRGRRAGRAARSGSASRRRSRSS